jgi:penicillin-binding protein 1A
VLAVNLSRTVRYLVRFTAICIVTAVGLAGAVFALVPQVATIATANHGEADSLSLDAPAERSYVYDKDGNILTTLHAEENRQSVSLDRIPTPVRDAVLAAEDETFYNHKGVNIRATIRALFTNVDTGGVAQGGSTITMQLVKNTILAKDSANRDFSLKSKEIVLARRLESQMSKDQILERYLNTVYFGNGAYGVQAAAEVYFGVSVESLDWPQAALLAALIRSPRSYDPFLNPALATERRRIALQRLVDTGKLTQAQADLYAFTPLPSAPHLTTAPNRDYFVEQVVQQLLDDPSYGLGDKDNRNAAVFKGGLRIYTTLDSTMQYKAVTARDSTLPEGEPAGLFAIKTSRDLSVCPKLNDGTYCLGTAGMVSIEPSTGAVKALVGGPGFDSWKYDVVTQSPGRQPGSSMKMFVLVTALENGYTINDLIDGSQCTFPIKGDKPYTVKGEGGVASLVKQTAGSVNCAFLRLGQLVGIDKVIEQARKMGLTGNLENVISFPLGTNVVPPLQMTGAYASIANDGMYNKPYFIDKITTATGDVIYEHKADPQRVMSVQTAREATVAFEAVVTGGTATRARLSDREAAGKTGTTDKHADAWFIGFTPQLTTGVWMGSPESESSAVGLNSVGGINVFGGTFPALIWHNYMTSALEGAEVLTFQAPEPVAGGKYLQLPKDKEVRQTPATDPGGGSPSSSTPATTTAPGQGPGPTTPTPPTGPPTPTTAPQPGPPKTVN